MKAPILCLSGGLDSVTCLALVGASECVFFDYGQTSVAREIEAARFYARYFKVPLQVVELPWLAKLSQGSALIQGDVPKFDAADLDDAVRTQQSAKAVWVPARNLVFLSAAAAVAESAGCDSVALGLNREEGVTFPDNGHRFIEAANRTLEFATLRKVRLETPVATFDKRQMVARLREKNVPLDFIWSCYQGGAEPCGVCESCARFKRALL